MLVTGQGSLDRSPGASDLQAEGFDRQQLVATTTAHKAKSETRVAKTCLLASLMWWLTEDLGTKKKLWHTVQQTQQDKPRV